MSLFENTETVTATGVVPVFRIRQPPEVPSLVGNGGLRSCPAWPRLANPTVTANAVVATNVLMRVLLAVVLRTARGPPISAHDHARNGMKGCCPAVGHCGDGSCCRLHFDHRF